jgi:hypothetical protein
LFNEDKKEEQALGQGPIGRIGRTIATGFALPAMNASRLEIFVPFVEQKEEYPTLLRGGSPIAGGTHVAQADREHSEQQMDDLDNPVIFADQQ